MSDLPDCMMDTDGDGFPLLIDNCPFVASDSLQDDDMDGIGNACEEN